MGSQLCPTTYMQIQFQSGYALNTPGAHILNDLVLTKLSNSSDSLWGLHYPTQKTTQDYLSISDSRSKNVVQMCILIWCLISQNKPVLAVLYSISTYSLRDESTGSLYDALIIARADDYMYSAERVCILAADVPVQFMALYVRKCHYITAQNEFKFSLLINNSSQGIVSVMVNEGRAILSLGSRSR